jgi:hypothetical protein
VLSCLFVLGDYVCDSYMVINMMVLQSIQNGVMGTGLKAERLQAFASDFEKFCEWVVLEFAEYDRLVFIAAPPDGVLGHH